MCGNPCIENRQNSLCCNICDEWVHLKCTDLTLPGFQDLNSSDKPFYCNNCLFGRTDYPLQDQRNIVSTILNSPGTPNLTPNSIFNCYEDLITSDYYTIDEINDFNITLSADNLLLVHFNAVSLYSNHDAILNTLQQFKTLPCLIFISETRVKDTHTDQQLSQIIIPGFSSLFHNSSTNAGGTAIYVSDLISFNVRKDINFNHPNCEATFIEISCDDGGPNPIFGSLYRHPGHSIPLFNDYLGEFLANFTAKNIKLTLFGDINIDLNKSNSSSIDYLKTVNSTGFSALINQPTRIFHYQTTNYLSCSTLDHIVTNTSPSFHKVGIITADISDHLPIFGFYSLSNKTPKSEKVLKPRRVFTEKKSRDLPLLDAQKVCVTYFISRTVLKFCEYQWAIVVIIFF